MSMSKQDFIALADALRKTRPEELLESDGSHNYYSSRGAVVQWQDICEEIAHLCTRANPAFKRERWMAYIAGECGPNGGTVKK